jgi:peptide/nickel transport system substrate-binding protein
MKRTVTDDKTQFTHLQSRRQFLRNTILMASSAVLTSAIAACSPAVTPTAAPAAPAAPAATAASGAAPAAVAPTAVAAAVKAITPTVIVKQKPLVLLQGVDPESLDPQYGESGISAQVYSNTIESLVQYNRKMELTPLLCESYQVLDDKVTWRWKLRQGVKFWNGEPFNAEAVKYTVERTMNAELRKAGLNDPFPARTGIDKVVIQDNYTVDMILKAPNIIMPVFTYFLYILEPKYYSSHSAKETALAPMGTGPWMVTDWVKGDHLTLEANPNYWRGAPPIKTVIFKPVAEKSTRMNLLLTGEADLVKDLDPDDISQLKGKPNVRPSIAPGSRRMHIGIPSKVAKYKDRRVRQALRYAIDWDGINTGLMAGLAEKRGTVLVAGADWIPADLKPMAFDPAKAKALLAEAAFPMDQAVKIYVPAGRYLKGEDICLAIAGQLRNVGLKADVQVLDWTVYSDKMRTDAGLDDLYLLGLGSRFNGPEDVSIVTTGQVWDQTGWIKSTENGPKFEAMYKQLQSTFDDKTQHQIVGDMLKLFDQESVWIPLFNQPGVSGASKCNDWEDSGGGGNFALWNPGEQPVKFTC